MHQPVLMYADVDEGSKLGHVGDDAFEGHAGLKIANLIHAFLETGSDEFVARIAARLAELFQDVVEGEDARGEAGLVDLLQQRGLLDQFLDGDV